METITRLAAAAGIVVLASAPASAGGLRGIAKELASAARSHHIERVAVLPLAPSDHSSPRHGWSLSEKLVTQLVRTGKVQAVERTMLQRLMEEQRLSRTGAMDPGSLRRLGRLSAAQGLVTGSFMPRGSKVLVNARLVDVESGVILAATEREVDREWYELPGVGRPSADQPLFVPAPEIDVPVPPLEGGFLELRDAPGEPAEAAPWDTPEGDRCADAASRVDRLEARILSLKARYWAARLKDGLDPRSLRFNPGSTISDPALKQRFFDSMKAWYRSPDLKPLDEKETSLFVDVDRQAFTLHRECGL